MGDEAQNDHGVHLIMIQFLSTVVFRMHGHEIWQACFQWRSQRQAW